MKEEPLSILVIDDDVVDRAAVKRYLSRVVGNADFFEADGSTAAIALLEKQRFDCIFLDYLLPEMDGITLLRQMYNSDTGLAVAPVVMLTGKGSEKVMIEAIRWGAQDYLVKDNITSDSLQIALTKAREMYELKLGQYKAAAQLRHSQKMEAVGQLTSGVAHDFNNLLTIILGSTRLIRRKLDENLDSVDVEAKLDAIEMAARKGADLVRTMMVFTRQRPAAAEIVNINDLIREIDELIRRPVGALIDVEIVFSPDLWLARMDRGEFGNALINLVVNARDAMPKGGKVTIETKNVTIDEEYTLVYPDMSPGQYVMTSVSDTGVGMSSEVAARVFEPFFTTKPAGEGTGLGLSMVYGMVRNAHGYIHVYSEEGHGTVFRMYMPRHDESGLDSDSDAPGMPGGTETILVVEDDERVRHMAVSMLDRLGYRTLQAEDGRIAVEILKREGNDVALLFSDVLLPSGMNGPQLAQHAAEYYPHIKVLFTSGYTEKSIPNYHLIEGHELIGKPYRKNILAGKIREILDKGKEKQA